MLFDTICKFIETTDDEPFKIWRNVIEDSKLFLIKNEIITTNPIDLDNEENRMRCTFMPYNSIAVEYETIDMVARKNGIERTITACDIITDSTGVLNIINKDAFKEFKSSETFKSLNTLSMLSCTRTHDGNVQIILIAFKPHILYKYQTMVQNAMMAACDKNGKQYKRHIEINTNHSASPILQESVELAYSLLYEINTPSKFIIEESFIRSPKRKGKKITRSHERNNYTIIDHHSIQKRYGLGKESKDGRITSAHFRRGHLRKLTSDRFVNKRGQLVRVSSCWIGPDWMQRGHKIYKVILDR